MPPNGTLLCPKCGAQVPFRMYNRTMYNLNSGIYTNNG